MNVVHFHKHQFIFNLTLRNTNNLMCGTYEIIINIVIVLIKLVNFKYNIDEKNKWIKKNFFKNGTKIRVIFIILGTV